MSLEEQLVALTKVKDNYSNTKMKEFSYAGFIGSNPVNHRCITLQMSGYESLVVGGSGLNHLKPLLDNYDYDLKETPMMNGIMKTVMIIAQLWSYDALNEQLNFKDDFGGGYQACYYHEGRWHRIDVYLLCVVISPAEDASNLLNVYAKFNYVEELLFFRVLELKLQSSQDKTDFIPKWRCYLAPWMNAGRPTEDRFNELRPRLLDMNAGLTAIAHRTLRHDGWVEGVLVFKNDDRKGPIQFQGDKVFFSEEFIENMKVQFSTAREKILGNKVDRRIARRLAKTRKN